MRSVIFRCGLGYGSELRKCRWVPMSQDVTHSPGNCAIDNSRPEDRKPAVLSDNAVLRAVSAIMAQPFSLGGLRCSI